MSSIWHFLTVHVIHTLEIIFYCSSSSTETYIAGHLLIRVLCIWSLTLKKGNNYFCHPLCILALLLDASEAGQICHFKLKKKLYNAFFLPRIFWNYELEKASFMDDKCVLLYMMTQWRAIINEPKLAAEKNPSQPVTSHKYQSNNLSPVLFLLAKLSQNANFLERHGAGFMQRN
jgi:hypothetical protein